MEYRYIQIVDTRQLVTIVAQRAQKLNMSAAGHALLAVPYRAEAVGKMTSYTKLLFMATPNGSLLKTMRPYVKVFGWDLVVKVDGLEYAINGLPDVVKIFDDYAGRHYLVRWHLEKGLLKGHGGASVSRLVYGTIKDIYLETLIAAVERLGGHIFLRQPKRAYNTNR